MIRLKNFYNFQPMNYRIEDPEKFKSKWVIKIEEISRPPTKLCSGANWN